VSERTFSYQPGGWFGIVGEHATVLLPGTEKARAGALWALVDDGAGFDAVLDALVAGGLSSLPGFVLLASDGDTTRVVIRGEASATLESAEGTVHVAGSTTSMWVERVLQEVTRLSVTLPDELPAGPRLSVVSGLVRLAGLETPAPRPALAVPPPPSTPPPPPRLELVPDPLTDDLDLLGDEDLARGADEGAGPVPVADDDTPTDGDVLGGPPAWTPATPPPPPPTTLPPIPPPGIPPVPGFPPPPPAAPSAWDDEPTEQMAAVPVDLGDAERAPERQPGSEPNSEHESEPEPEWERPAPVAHLSFSSGDEVDVDGLVVIGRAPDAGRFPADEEPTLVTVPSPHSEISSTHVEVRPGTGADHGSAVVTDLGSTNGTLLVQPGQRPEELRPGVPVVLQSGAMIDLGDGLTIRVSKI
jgi:hypothetical protein